MNAYVVCVLLVSKRNYDTQIISENDEHQEIAMNNWAEFLKQIYLPQCQPTEHVN